MHKRVFHFLLIATFLGCASPKKGKDDDENPPTPVERKLQLKGGAVEMKLSEDEKIRAKPKGGGAFFELVIDY
jgi:hypothetical protein